MIKAILIAFVLLLVVAKLIIDPNPPSVKELDTANMGNNDNRIQLEKIGAVRGK